MRQPRRLPPIRTFTASAMAAPIVWRGPLVSSICLSAVTDLAGEGRVTAAAVIPEAAARFLTAVAATTVRSEPTAPGSTVAAATEETTAAGGMAGGTRAAGRASGRTPCPEA